MQQLVAQIFVTEVSQDRTKMCLFCKDIYEIINWLWIACGFNYSLFVLFLAPNEFTRLAQVISNNIHKINQNG